jgi:hypothetical protein
MRSMARKGYKARRPREREIDVPTAFGADPTFAERFSIYIADRDQLGKDIDQRRWVREALELLTDINGGASALPPMDGLWRNLETGNNVEERTIVVYSFVRAEAFAKRIDEVVQFVKRYGREANQGEVAMQYGEAFFSITDYE